ncbi:PadR family transcriptional regulator [Alkalihalobacterium chitinilyticum]|uniref:PadR family transcriptional regulator n=1 Tax=Alkalihalobacterium chitinilyticum TaxID=2980103 RepID=A0ABT5VL41_9BACI|nr:PadR family transcriptional regulator [Alkalihalobacterium chitinilyticum]MDE5416163.1 PadR family transcriptional regulator [Alkalihalobacterium chitinilyticum]
MKNYNHTTYSILGILTTGCNTGYAIKQLMDNSLNHFWKISYGQIYPTLKLIVQEGLAEVQTVSNQGKPDRQEYYLTSKGMETLKDWLEQPIEQLPMERNEILLKLFFGQYQTEEQSRMLIENYKQKLEERYETYVTIEYSIMNHHDNEEDAKYWLITLDYGKRVTAAALEWCNSTLDKLVSKEGL